MSETNFYVDGMQLCQPWGRPRRPGKKYTRVSHLVTDGTVLELLEFGEKIGLKPEWLQTNKKGQSPTTWTPHFDLVEGMFEKAIKAGATNNREMLVRQIQAWREKVQRYGVIQTISVWQPWAWCIIHAGKDIENRTWINKNFTGPVFIHASKKFNEDSYKQLLGHTEYLDIDLPEPKDFKTGGIIGAVNITGYTQESDSIWFSGPYGWQLENPRKLPFIPYTGSQGLFRVPRALYEGVL